MYAQSFGLEREPFSIAPDPRYLFMSQRHREALAHLLYGMESGGGFVLLSGEIGTGKTTVCRYVLEQIPERCNLAYIFNPKLTVLELLQSVCDEFHVPRPQTQGQPTVKDYVDPLNAFLLQAHASGRSSVLIIDEAQNLSSDVLEQLRLLTNLETSERKLLQIILIGQPELRQLLAQPQLEQLAQRVVARFHLQALSKAETGQYIAHRLSVAGLRGPIPFERAATLRIHQLARGIPRRINLLCDRAMLGAFASGSRNIDRAIVERAAAEVLERSELAGAPASAGALSRAGLLGLGLAAGVALIVAANALLGARVESPAALTGTAPATRPAIALPAAPAVAPPPPSPVATLTPNATSAAPVLPDAQPLGTTEAAAWGDLAALWGESGANPCQRGTASPVQCFKAVGSLALVRQLGRPVVLRLQAAGQPVTYAVLTGIGVDSATLLFGGAAHQVPLARLGAAWRGEFAALWRAPPGFAGGVWDGQRSPAVDWLAQQLARWRGQAEPGTGLVLDAALRAQVQSFQLAQGLVPDGRPGPLTLMLLNRVGGVAEPVLQTGPSYSRIGS